jgi:hypothetical protein
MRISRLAAPMSLLASSLLASGTGCCCFKPTTLGTVAAPPAYTTPPVYQAPPVVQQQPPVVVQQPAVAQPTYVQPQACCQPVVCQPACNPCCQ